jgi:hypothetical protein
VYSKDNSRDEGDMGTTGLREEVLDYILSHQYFLKISRKFL